MRCFTFSFSILVSPALWCATLQQKKMSIWDAFRALDTITDESDPDTDEPQCVHAFQTAEMIRRDNHPEWMILVGLVHDLGKVPLRW